MDKRFLFESTSKIRVGAASVFLVLLAQFGLQSPASATPGVPAAPTVVYLEDFENNPDNTPTGAKGFTVPGSTYIGAAGQTYTGAADWIDGANCNGVILSFNNSTIPAWVQCPGQYGFIRDMARTLGAGGGAAPADLDNHAQSAYTGQAPLVGTGYPNGVMFQTVTPIPVTVNRFYTFQANTSSNSCGPAQSHGLFNFGLLDGANTFIPVTGGDVDICSAPFTPDAAGLGHRLKTVSSTAAVLYTQASVRVVLFNNQANQGNGNDEAFDNVTLLDATPTLDKTFSPTSVPVAGTSVMTFTITNTTDLLGKSGWGFVETMPAGLVIAATPNLVNTCAPPDTGVTTITATAGANTVTVTNVGLAPGAPNNCTISVNVTSAAAATYNNTAANITSITALLPPVLATLTFTNVVPVSTQSIPTLGQTGLLLLALLVAAGAWVSQRRR